MEIKHRIRNIMISEGYNAGKFAEEIGVQASALSHILSGRNNPSYDLIVKIITRFPSVNSHWLLTGKGSMSTSEEKPQTPKMQGLFETEEPIRNSIKEDNPEHIIPPLYTPPIDKSEQVTTVTESNAPIAHTNQITKIIRIVELYDDGTARIFDIR